MRRTYANILIFNIFSIIYCYHEQIWPYDSETITMILSTLKRSNIGLIVNDSTTMAYLALKHGRCFYFLKCKLVILY